MDQTTAINESEHKLRIDATVKIGTHDMKFKATGYLSSEQDIFSVIIYDKLYELSRIHANSETPKWHFTTENLLPEDLATIIGNEIERQSMNTIAA